MNKNSNTLFGSKQMIQKNIVDADDMFYGAGLPQNGGDKVAVRFAVHEGETVAKGADGQLVFNKLGNTGAIYLGDTLVSSKILDVTYAPKTNASAGINEIVIKYLDDSGVINTTDALEVVNDARVAALIADFKKDVFDPYKDATNASIGRIDTSVNNLETWAKNAANLTEAGNGAITVTPAVDGKGFQTWTVGTNVDDKTIVINGEDKLATAVKIQYVAAKAAEGDGAAVPAHIALMDKDGAELSKVEVSDLVGNGVLHHSAYDKTTGKLTLYFTTAAAGKFEEVVVDLGAMLDVNDVLVADGSQKYVGIDLSGEENSQFVLSTKMHAVKTATAEATGLVDAYDVKSTLDASFGALAANLDASTNYISVGIEQENGLIQNLVVNSSVSDVTGTKGTAGVYNTEGAETTAPTHGMLAGVANALADSAQSMSKVKDYVDGEVAIEAARTDAAILAAVKALDKEETTSISDEHLTIKYSELDGIVTINASTADIASAALLGTKNDASTAETAFGYIAKEAALRKQAIEALDVTSNTVDGTNTHVTYKEENGIVTIQSISEDYATVKRTAHVDKTESAEMVAAKFEVTAGDEGKLVKASDLASLKSYADDKIAEAVADQAAILDGLDKTVKDEVDDFIKITIVQENGLLKSTDLDIKYGAMGTYGVNGDNGLATTNLVQTYVDNALTWQVIA